MRTKWGRIFIALFLVALGLLVVGCQQETDRVVKPPAGQQELELKFFGDGGKGTRVEIGGQETISLASSDLYWFYDIPDDKTEYALITYSSANMTRYLFLHLHISKQPPKK